MNLNKLNAKFVELGINKEDFAREAFGISLQALNKKLNGSTKITVDDAIIFCNGLQITDDRDKCEIFLS
jgi:plasmid maintenance system antidote protein VapI